MEWGAITGCAVLVFYALLLLVIFAVLILRKQQTNEAINIDFTAIVPFRNEGNGIILRIAEVSKSLSGTNKKAIFINDHSDDLPPEILNAAAIGQVTMLHLPDGMSGKKAAITFGVKHSGTEWVLTSDTDTRIDFDSIEGQSVSKIRSRMCTLPVRPEKQSGVFPALFSLEFVVLQAVGIGLASMRMPLLANGAALLFKRLEYEETLPERADLDTPHGDDIFTLLAFAKKYGVRSIEAAIPPFAPATASFDPTASGLWNQRLRWISKVPGINDLKFNIIAWMVALANLGWILALCYSLATGTAYCIIFASLLKWLPETMLAAWGVLYFRRPDCFIWILPALIVYPFYLWSLMITSIFVKPRWK